MDTQLASIRAIAAGILGAIIQPPDEQPSEREDAAEGAAGSSGRAGGTRCARRGCTSTPLSSARASGTSPRSACPCARCCVRARRRAPTTAARSSSCTTASSDKPLMLQLKSRAEMRRLLGLLHLHCLRNPAARRAPGARWSWRAGSSTRRTAPSPEFRRAAHALLGRHSTHGIKTMVLDGVQWQLLGRARRRRRRRRRGRRRRGHPSRRAPRPLIRSSPTTAACPLHRGRRPRRAARRRRCRAARARQLCTRPRRQGRQPGCARSEEEAREWVSALDETLFTQSRKATSVVRCESRQLQPRTVRACLVGVLGQCTCTASPAQRPQ